MNWLKYIVVCVAMTLTGFVIYSAVSGRTAEANTVTNPEGHVSCACNATKCCCGVAMGYVPNMTCQ